MVIMRHLLRVTFAIITAKCKQFPPTKVNANIFFYKHNPTLSKLNRFWLALNVCQNRNCLKWNEVNSLVLCCHIHPNMSVHEIANYSTLTHEKKKEKMREKSRSRFYFYDYFHSSFVIWFLLDQNKKKIHFSWHLNWNPKMLRHETNWSNKMKRKKKVSFVSEFQWKWKRFLFVSAHSSENVIFRMKSFAQMYVLLYVFVFTLFFSDLFLSIYANS